MVCLHTAFVFEIQLVIVIVPSPFYLKNKSLLHWYHSQHQALFGLFTQHTYKLRMTGMFWNEKCDLSTLDLYKTDADHQNMSLLCPVRCSQLLCQLWVCCSCRYECRARKTCSFYFGNNWFANTQFDSLFFRPQQSHCPQSSKGTVTKILWKNQENKYHIRQTN